MKNIYLLITLLSITITFGCYHKKDKMDLSKKSLEEVNNDEIFEVPNEGDVKKSLDNEMTYDYKVSEAAVGNIEGVPFTVGGIHSEEIDGKNQNTTYLDINKEKFVEIVKGTIVNLKAGVSVEIVDIVIMDPPKKGCVYFKVIK